MAVETKTIFLKTGRIYVELVGESTEEKPTENIAPGSFFLETDTGTLYSLGKNGEWSEFGKGGEG